MGNLNLWQIPVTSDPNQTLQVSLSIDNTSLDLQLEFHYNSEAGYWTMDVAAQDGDYYVVGVPLLPGVYPAANILQPYAYMGIGSAYVVPVAVNVTEDWPGENTLGTDFQLWWSDTPGINATPIGIPAGYKEAQGM